MASEEGCPFAENTTYYICFKRCRAERISGQWKICAASRFDPLPMHRIEVIGTMLTDETGSELYEVYESKIYKGSLYAASPEEALEKAHKERKLKV
ncbi:MAG: hypothetical protein WCS37_07085 [Chloroflexota bacterium]|nr:hypothetical protein [Chloroflexota bacterium]